MDWDFLCTFAPQIINLLIISKMIIAKKLVYKSSHEAERENWKALTSNFNESVIEALVSMQECQKDKLSVIQYISDALERERQLSLFGDAVKERLVEIREYIERGLYSPYVEIKRLIDEGQYKDKQLDEMMNSLKNAIQDSDRKQEQDLLDRLVEQAMALGIDACFYTEIGLRRMYDKAPERCKKQTDKLMEFAIEQRKTHLNFYQPVGIVAPNGTIYSNQQPGE